MFHSTNLSVACTKTTKNKIRVLDFMFFCPKIWNSIKNFQALIRQGCVIEFSTVFVHLPHLFSLRWIVDAFPSFHLSESVTHFALIYKSYPTQLFCFIQFLRTWIKSGRVHYCDLLSSELLAYSLDQLSTSVTGL